MGRPVAIVTGASSGIGEAVAMRLADRGFDLGLTARRVDQLERVARSIQERGGQAVVAPADAGDPSATRAAMAHLLASLGTVDLLIANAGMAEYNPARGHSAKSFERLLRVNVLGAAYAIEAALPMMLAKGQGQIVGVSSLAGHRSFMAGHAPYSASKAALSTWLDGMRAELQGSGVLVTVVHPGFVRTPMTAGGAGRGLGMMELDRAADIMVRGILAGRARVDFPWLPARIMGLARALPTPLFDAAFRRFNARFGARASS